MVKLKNKYTLSCFASDLYSSALAFFRLVHAINASCKVLCNRLILSDLEEDALSQTLLLESEPMVHALGAKTSGILELNVDLDIEGSPANSREEERSFRELDLVLSEGRMEVVSDGLDVLLCLLRVVVEGDEHAPSVTVLMCLFSTLHSLWVLDFLVSVTECELDKSHAAEPFTSVLKLLLAFLEHLTHRSGDLSLQLNIDLRNEELVEMCAAHRTSHSCFDDPLMALEAHKVLAWSKDGLSAQLEADRALIVIPLSTFNPVRLAYSAAGGSKTR